MKKRQTKKNEYEPLVEKVMDQVCEKYTYPIKQKYAEAIAELKSKDCAPGTGFTPESVRSNVSRAIDRMCDETPPRLLCYKGKYYIPNNEKYLFEKLSEDFYKYLHTRIQVDKKKVLFISCNTCAFFASIKPDYKEKEEEKGFSIHQYIGNCLDDYLFAIFGEDNFVQAMVKCSTDFAYIPDKYSIDFTVLRALENALTRIYEEDHRTF